MTDGRLLKVVMLEALEVSAVGERAATKLGEVRMEGVRCQGCEWVDNEKSKAGVEGHSMEGSVRGMEGSS